MTVQITLNMNDDASEKFAELLRKATDAAGGVDKLDDAMKRLENSAKRDFAMAQKITAVSTATSAVIQSMKGLMEAGRKVAEVVSALADRGNIGAMQLEQSFSQVREELLRIADDPAIQDMFIAIGNQAKSTAKDIASIPTSAGGLKEMAAWAADVIEPIDMLGASTALLRHYSSDLEEVRNKEIQRRAELEQQVKAQQHQAEVMKQIKIVQQDQLAIQAKLFADYRREQLESVKDAKALVDLREKELAKLKALASEGKLTDDARRKGLAEIAVIEERRLALNREIVEEARKEAEARQKWIATVQGQAKTLGDAFKQAYGKAADAAKKNLDAILAKEQKTIDTLAKKIQDLRGGADGSQDLLQSIRGKLDPRATLRQIAEDRARKAVQQVAGAGGDEREQRRAAVKARETAFRQARAGGRFDDTEVAQAQKELTQGVIDGAVQSGKLSATQAKALKQAAETVGQVAENQAQMQENIEQIEKVLNEQMNLANAVNRRQRAQRSGG